MKAVPGSSHLLKTSSKASKAAFLRWLGGAVEGWPPRKLPIGATVSQRIYLRRERLVVFQGLAVAATALQRGLRSQSLEPHQTVVGLTAPEKR
jgi:hypothetical protein